jgi:DNA-binding CsgD family transcriptional regulator
VLAHLAQGQRTRAIADALCVSVKTAETHLRHVREKAGLTHHYKTIVFAVWWSIYSGEVAA